MVFFAFFYDSFILAVAHCMIRALSFLQVTPSMVLYV
jgi:hypothetical protein